MSIDYNSLIFFLVFSMLTAADADFVQADISGEIISGNETIQIKGKVFLDRTQEKPRAEVTIWTPGDDETISLEIPRNGQVARVSTGRREKTLFPLEILTKGNISEILEFVIKESGDSRMEYQIKEEKGIKHLGEKLTKWSLLKTTREYLLLFENPQKKGIISKSRLNYDSNTSVKLDLENIEFSPGK